MVAQGNVNLTAVQWFRANAASYPTKSAAIVAVAKRYGLSVGDTKRVYNEAFPDLKEISHQHVRSIMKDAGLIVTGSAGGQHWTQKSERRAPAAIEPTQQVADLTAQLAALQAEMARLRGEGNEVQVGAGESVNMSGLGEDDGDEEYNLGESPFSESDENETPDEDGSDELNNLEA